jgi:hypothetical protein
VSNNEARSQKPEARRKRSLVVGVLPLVFVATLGAASVSAAERWAVLITGISGDPDLQKEYLAWNRSLYSTLSGPLGFAKERIVVLFEDTAPDPAIIRYKSTRENLEKVCRDLSGRVRREDLVFVFIAGHGNFDGKIYKLNLPGPDPTAEELADMLYGIPAERFVVVNTTTASGGSVAALARKGKVLLSATKSGQEKNQTHLGKYFVEALAGGDADADKNGRVSILEAFNYAVRKVEEFYSKEGNLQTEHAVLEDDGDGTPHTKPGPDNGDGFLARTTYLDGGASREAARLAPEQAQQAREAQELETQIEALKYAKASMAEAEYEKKLEALLLRLAQVNAKLKAAPKDKK